MERRLPTKEGTLEFVLGLGCVVIKGGRFVKLGFEAGERAKDGRDAVERDGDVAADRDCTSLIP